MDGEERFGAMLPLTDEELDTLLRWAHRHVPNMEEKTIRKALRNLSDEERLVVRLLFAGRASRSKAVNSPRAGLAQTREAELALGT